MDERLFQDMPENQRKQMLSDNCYKINPEYIYQKGFSPEELEKLKNDLLTDMLKKASIDAEFKNVKKDFNDRLTPIKKGIGESLVNLKYKSREVVEEVFMMADQESGMMGIYNERGELLASRRLVPEEKQLRIKKAVNE